MSSNVLDHSYAHMIEKAGRRPVVVTGTISCRRRVALTDGGGLAEGVRNRFFATGAQVLRQADAYIVARVAETGARDVARQ